MGDARDGAVVVVDVPPPTAVPRSAHSPKSPASSSLATSGADTTPVQTPPLAGPAPFFVDPMGCLARGRPPEFASADVADRAEALLVALAAGPDDSRRVEGWTTRVAASHQVSVRAVGDNTLELVVPATAQNGNQSRDEWWTAQLVHTATSLPGISTVRFVDRDGRPVQAPVQGSSLASSEVALSMVPPACP